MIVEMRSRTIIVCRFYTNYDMIQSVRHKSSGQCFWICQHVAQFDSTYVHVHDKEVECQ